MSLCGLCETEVPEGWQACGACGHPVGRAVTRASGSDAVRRTLAAARQALLRVRPDSVDLTFARHLLERAEQTEAAGDRGRALDLARGARRGVDLAKRRARVEAALARAVAILQEAQAAGIETLTFERNIAQARTFFARGNYAGADRLVRRLSIRTLDQRRERQLQAVLDKAAARVRYAKERGADVAEADALLARAREALSTRDYGRLRTFAGKAIETAESARRHARSEAILNNVAIEVDRARKAGVAVAEARKTLTQARDALRRGLYADVQRLALRGRQQLRETRRHSSVEHALRETEHHVVRQARHGVDVARAESLLSEARGALDVRDYGRVTSLSKEAGLALRDVMSLRRVRDAYESLRLDAEDLHRLGVDAGEFDAGMRELERAIAANDLSTARAFVTRCRHSAESAREGHFRGIMERSLSIILANAARGLDPEIARSLLREVDEALSLGRPVDVQALVDERMSAIDAETTSRLSARILQGRDFIVELRAAGQDTLAMEGKLADAADALEARRFSQSDALLDAVEHDIWAVREILRSEAAEMLGQARAEVANARNAGVPIEACIRFLHDAEVAYGESRYVDVLTLSRTCVAEIEARHRVAEDERQRVDTRASQVREERVAELQLRMAHVRGEMHNLIRDHEDLARALEILSEAERAIHDGNLEEAERNVVAAEGLVTGVKTALRQQAEDVLQEIRRKAVEARNAGLATDEIEALFRRAEEALHAGRPAEALESTAAASKALEDRQRERLLEEQRAAMEKARMAAGKYVTVKKLVEDLRKADIEVAGAEANLKNAERALAEKAYDRVDEILADLDATATELKEELVAAARTLLNRAGAKINQARADGIDVREALESFNKAEAYFDRGDYDDSVEYARSAERKIQEVVAAVEKELAAKTRETMEKSRTKMAGMKKMLADLSRADISIVNADDAIERAEIAFAEGRFDDVDDELRELDETAQSLTAGMEVAATDLVRVAEQKIQEARASGVVATRAEVVLTNAREAVADRRFVEAIEYKTVIEDILDDVRRQESTRHAQGTLLELRARFDAHAKLGADVRVASEILTKTEERVSKGNTKDLETYVRQVQESIEIARRAHMGSLVESLKALVQEGSAMGLPIDELTTFQDGVTRAAREDDLEEVYRIKGDLQERILEVKRQALLKKALQEVQALDEILAQSDRMGIPTSGVKVSLDDARRAIEGGNVDGFHKKLNEARGTLEVSRTRYFAQKYESRVHAVSTMIANAKRIGADVTEAERALSDAESAVRENDTAMADILVKQAEVAIGVQVQNFIKNRYPNLVLRLPATGLQANVWNRYVFEIENRGKLPARNVEIEFGGDLEAKGLAPISEIGVEERRIVDIGLKPKRSGDVPMQVNVGYQRTFDENRYDVKDAKDVKVEPEGTYLVEDVFLIHSDGRLVSHQSRKFREAIDEDIFSGMLTVVQDFIQDSFKRSRTALRRLEFGDSKILIERSPHTFLACVLVGQEPKLLPLYMIEVLKEIEDRFGPTLERWNGLLGPLEGIDPIIAKLVFVARDSKADLGALADSPITLTAKVIEAIGVEQTEEVNALLREAQSSLETDLQLSWEFIEKAKEQAELARTHLGDRMHELVAAIRDTVKELQAIGADTSQADLLMREAEEAVHEGKFDRVREIHKGLHESLERAKGEITAKKFEVELASLINEIQVAKSQNLDPREAESFLTKIEDAVQRKSDHQVEEFLRRAKESLARQRRHSVLERAREDLRRLRGTLEEAKGLKLDLGDVEVILARAESAIQGENLKDLELLLRRAEATAKAHVQEVLKDRYPRLFLEAASVGLQATRWNRFQLQITNKGNWPAQDVTPTVLGPIDVQGLRTIDRIEPNGQAVLDLGIRPHEAGTMDLDFEVHYRRPLDESRQQVTDSSSVRVEAEGGYSVDDALLFHAGGSLICHESRAYAMPEERSQLALLESEARSLAARGSDPDRERVRRATMGERGLVAVAGPNVVLVLGLRGREPPILPLFMVQSLKEVQDAYGPRLEGWSGDPDAIPGIREAVRKILYATDSEGVSLGPLEDSLVSRVPVLMAKGILQGDERNDFLDWARDLIASSGYEGGVRVLDELQAVTAGPTEEISVQIQQAVLASRESGGLQLSDEQVQSYVDVLRRTLEAVIQSKIRAGIERYWPVARLAVKATEPMVYDVVTAFRKIIVGQSGAKELDIVSPAESWRGMKVTVQVHMGSVSASYRLWAKKIESLLQSQDAWKIKQGLEKGEYSVGIEGQKVRIDSSMVSFLESLPGHVIEEPFQGGIVYLDTQMSSDLLAEGYAREIVNIVQEARKDLRLPNDRTVEVDIAGGGRIQEILRPWLDLILREANVSGVGFVRAAPADAYVVETQLGDSRFLLAVRPLPE